MTSIVAMRLENYLVDLKHFAKDKMFGGAFSVAWSFSAADSLSSPTTVWG